LKNLFNFLDLNNIKEKNILIIYLLILAMSKIILRKDIEISETFKDVFKDENIDFKGLFNN
jgi:hypothetical protein